MSRTTCIISLACWCLLVGCGCGWAFMYQMTPSPQYTPPAVWPSECALTDKRTQPTLLVFVHPKCPCTRATFRQLERFLTRHQQKLQIYVVISKPASAPIDWEDTDLLASAKALPDACVIIDDQDEIRSCFQASTSGEILLYGVDGRLQFQGGITPGRGHEGANPGEAILAALLKQETPDLQTTPVFGCGLETKKSCCEGARR